MSTQSETSDAQVLEWLRREPMSVSQLARATAVTATAVRQRLTRLLGQGLVQRETSKTGRGRPSHRYSLTTAARRQAGNNFADLATVLWREIRAVKDPMVRRGLIERIAKALAGMYASEFSGKTVAARADELVQLLGDRRMPFTTSGCELPVLTALDCPYPELAEQDRGICAVERIMVAELLQADVKLSQCRLDGHSCCQFQTQPLAAAELAAACQPVAP